MDLVRICSFSAEATMSLKWVGPATSGSRFGLGVATLFVLVASDAWALPGTVNLSLLPTATATASASAPDAGFDTSPDTAIDGNRDGNYGNGSVFYRNANLSVSPLFYQVDLGTSAYIERVQMIRRSDASDGVFNNMDLTIYADDGNGQPGSVVFQGNYHPTNWVVGSWGTTDPGKSAAGGALGRFVKLTLLDSPYWLDFAEFEVIGSTTPLTFTDSNNLALGKSVTTSSEPAYGALLESANDGNIDGSFGYPGNRPVYHSSTSSVGEWWQVDLGEVKQLDHLQLFARGDNYNTSEFRVTVLDASQALVDSFLVVNNPLTDANPGYDHVINTAGSVGRYIKVETTKEEHLVFTELRAFEGPGSSFPTGDYNQNGVVDDSDYTAWKLAYGTANAAADGNSDGIVDAADYTIWRDNLGGSGSGGLGANSVPEPSTLVLLLGVALLPFARRR
jgi:hypothetical protein